MFFNLRLALILASMALMLSGCGDLLGKKVIKRSLDPSQFQVDCELDINEFTEIVNKNISSQIKCLGENLNLFIKIVKSGKPGYLSRVQLERYLAEFRPDVKPEVVKALKSIFELGHVITGEEPDYISKETVEKVINFALIFNEEAALHFGPIFQSESQVSYDLHKNHRDRVSNANKAIIGALRHIFNTNRNGQIHKINIIELLDSFSTDETRESIEKVKKILFVKKIMFGGSEDFLTHVELEKIILNFDYLVLIVLDAVRFKYIDLEQDSILQLLKRDVNDLYDIINQGSLSQRDEEVLFTMDQAITAAKLYIDEEEFEFDKYRSLINEGKKIVMHGNEIEVKGKELKNLFNHAKSLLQTGTIFYRIWDKFKVQLMSPGPVTINFDEYRYTYPEHQLELDQFERIAKNYRFFKGEFLSPYFTFGYKRNPSAFFEIALYEYALKLIFQTYGSPSYSSPVGGYSMDRFQMQRLVKKFENELIDMDLLLPLKAESFADNISLLGTLFQFQSDKNNLLDVNEASEFATTVFTGLEMDDDIFTYMKEQNDCEVDEFNRIHPTCYRRHFWKGLCKYYRSYFPLMFESFGSNSCEDLEDNRIANELLVRSVEAGRSCNYYTDGDKEEVPYSKSDVLTTVVVLMHTETTILRWDANKNNKLESGELDKAYEVYSGALDGFLEEKSPIIKRFKKQIYQYLIKYEEVPDENDFGSVWKFVKFLLKFNKNLSATRKTMASILVAIANENAKLRKGPEFDCKYLRDPENIPRDPQMTPPRSSGGQNFSSVLTPYLHLAVE